MLRCVLRGAKSCKPLSDGAKKPVDTLLTEARRAGAIWGAAAKQHADLTNHLQTANEKNDELDQQLQNYTPHRAMMQQQGVLQPFQC